ncbi:MAG: 16S rRNA (cytosine(1402)-N(4))-methyltransferase RsmH [Candidatus Latescibacteria bacterium]|nr:16S rRNA (cytosine(1402)-N(4))-methyltransferase RsmH [Candidatus Latescibacterota bacterium]
MAYHVPVMVEEVVAGLVADPDGAYVDATAGGGGHSWALLQVLSPKGRLLAVDRDREAVAAARAKLAADTRAVVRQGRFAELSELLAQEGIGPLSGVLFDLGVSSHQIDASARGFSYQADGPLDMRMDAEVGPTAAELIAACSESELAELIARYGEERAARRIARSIYLQQRLAPLTTTQALRQAVAATRPQMLNKTLARVFQALRIAVNDELGQLQAGLTAAEVGLKPGGRLAVLAYHSLEDRLVKQHFAALVRGCICPPRVPICTCGRKPSFKRVGYKLQRASAAEIKQNTRARSAILRIYEKIEAG